MIMSSIAMMGTDSIKIPQFPSQVQAEEAASVVCEQFYEGINDGIDWITKRTAELLSSSETTTTTTSPESSAPSKSSPAPSLFLSTSAFGGRSGGSCGGNKELSVKERAMMVNAWNRGVSRKKLKIETQYNSKDTTIMESYEPKFPFVGSSTLMSASLSSSSHGKTTATTTNTAAAPTASASVSSNGSDDSSFQQSSRTSNNSRLRRQYHHRLIRQYQYLNGLDGSSGRRRAAGSGVNRREEESLMGRETVEQGQIDHAMTGMVGVDRSKRRMMIGGAAAAAATGVVDHDVTTPPGSRVYEDMMSPSMMTLHHSLHSHALLDGLAPIIEEQDEDVLSSPVNSMQHHYERNLSRSRHDAISSAMTEEELAMMTLESRDDADDSDNNHNSFKGGAPTGGGEDEPPPPAYWQTQPMDMEMDHHQNPPTHHRRRRDGLANNDKNKKDPSSSPKHEVWMPKPEKESTMNFHSSKKKKSRYHHHQKGTSRDDHDNLSGILGASTAAGCTMTPDDLAHDMLSLWTSNLPKSFMSE
jgi:hypothetical protein